MDLDRARIGAAPLCVILGISRAILLRIQVHFPDRPAHLTFTEAFGGYAHAARFVLKDPALLRGSLEQAIRLLRGHAETRGHCIRRRARPAVSVRAIEAVVVIGLERDEAHSVGRRRHLYTLLSATNAWHPQTMTLHRPVHTFPVVSALSAGK